VPEDFLIEPGDGYEFVATKDTTWNPAEYSNEVLSSMMVRQGVKRSDVAMQIGASLESDRVPVWSVAVSKEKVDYSDARVYAPVQKYGERRLDYREPGISHIVHVALDLEGFEGLVFTAYRPHSPYDVMTEQSVGCVTVRQGGVYRLISFDVGNFREPWRDGEEVVLIIEATKDGRGYFTIVNFELDKGVDIQQVSDDIMLILIPEPVADGRVVRWSGVENDNVVGYSLYRDGERINEKVITESDYLGNGDVVVKLAIKGGYETVYSSRQRPLSVTEDMHIPIAYSFNVFPNPFAQETRVDYAVPCQTSVEIVIYDVSGRQVRTLADEMIKAGYYSRLWNGADEQGRSLSSGVYFIKCEAGGFADTKKLLLIR